MLTFKSDTLTFSQMGQNGGKIKIAIKQLLL